MSLFGSWLVGQKTTHYTFILWKAAKCLQYFPQTSLSSLASDVSFMISFHLPVFGVFLHSLVGFRVGQLSLLKPSLPLVYIADTLGKCCIYISIYTVKGNIHKHWKACQFHVASYTKAIHISTFEAHRVLLE